MSPEQKNREKSIRKLEDMLVGKLISNQWSKAGGADEAWVVGEYHVGVTRGIRGGIVNAFVVSGSTNDSTPIIRRGTKAFRKLERHFFKISTAEAKLTKHNMSVQHNRDLTRLIYGVEPS